MLAGAFVCVAPRGSYPFSRLSRKRSARRSPSAPSRSTDLPKVHARGLPRRRREVEEEFGETHKVKLSIYLGMCLSYLITKFQCVIELVQKLLRGTQFVIASQRGFSLPSLLYRA